MRSYRREQETELGPELGWEERRSPAPTMNNSRRRLITADPVSLGFLDSLRNALLGYHLLNVPGGLVTNSCNSRNKCQSIEFLDFVHMFERQWQIVVEFKAMH